MTGSPPKQNHALNLVSRSQQLLEQTKGCRHNLELRGTHTYTSCQTEGYQLVLTPDTPTGGQLSWLAGHAHCMHAHTPYIRLQGCSRCCLPLVESDANGWQMPC